MNALSDWLQQSVAPFNKDYLEYARSRQVELTKPAGSLGRLEELAIFMAAAQSSERPVLERIDIAVFVADHGIAAEGVSAFPQSVTVQMIGNLANGGAAISVLAKDLGAHFEIINLGTVEDAPSHADVWQQIIARGTDNFLHAPAMSDSQYAEALNAGRMAAERALQRDSHLFIGGEVGIANTTSATAIACALLNETAANMAGPGTGLDRRGLAHKIDVLGRALDHHRPELVNTAAVLRCLGGFEIVALTGAYIHCAQYGLPVMIDGFISSVAALAAERLCPDVSSWFIYGHSSAEPGHARVLAALDGSPLLSLGMRLGEGSGAATAVPLLKLACTLHNDMATFAEAEVAGRCTQ